MLLFPVAPRPNHVWLHTVTKTPTLPAIALDLKSSRHLPPLEVAGYSRSGRPIPAVSLGKGRLQATLIAGSHAEEPAGPAFLRALIPVLSNPHHPSFDHLILPELAGVHAGKHLLEVFTLHIIPHLNPDGEQKALDSGWLNPAPVDGEPFCASAEAFHLLAIREMPGEDIEFGWPWSSEELESSPDAHPVPHVPPTTTRLREENAAAAQWLFQKLARPRDMNRPLVFHGSLHGMAFASGAWCLLGRSWTPFRRIAPLLPESPSGQLCSPAQVAEDRSAPLRSQIAAAVFRQALPLHDMDRGGEKGFDRLGPGFATAPDVWSMRHHFLSQEPPDTETASRFRPASMDFVRGLGLDPLILVTEVPLFLLQADQARVRMANQQRALEVGGLPALNRLPVDEAGQSPLEKMRKQLSQSPTSEECFREYRVGAISAETQVRLVSDMVFAGLAAAAAQQPAIG